MKIKIKKLNEYATIPFHGSEYAAGYDVTAAIDAPLVIAPHTTVKVGTGLAFELPEGYFMDIRPRSGLATKKGLRPANTPGTCDADYRGEYIVALHNDTNMKQEIEPGERIAQIILRQYTPMEFEEVDELSDTVRSDGGFGSTGRI